MSQLLVRPTPCVSMATRRALAKNFNIREQTVHQHGYILIIHFIFVGISCIIAILPDQGKRLGPDRNTVVLK